MGSNRALIAMTAIAFLLTGAAAWALLRGREEAPPPASPPAPLPVPAPVPAPPPPPPPPPVLPEYAPREKMTGKIRSVGSDTMNNLITLWAEGFRTHHPAVWFEVEGKGSSTATPALIAGTAELGPMSREMKPKEIAEFEKRHGYRPTGLGTSIDMLAVFVHRDNPIQGLTLPQVDAIFSRTRRAKHPNDIRTWGDLGLTGEWADKPIRLYGRNSASGTYGYFKQHALSNGDFKDTVMEQPGSSSVVRGVAGDRFGIGYVGVGYLAADVKAVPLAAKPGQPFVEAVPANAHSRAYPLCRFLLLYVNRWPDAPLDPLRREFLLFVFSRQGQAAVVKDGYIPLAPSAAREELAKVGL